ncbi:MAG: TolC family protein, partial [Bacteroidales bacterium]|nr:TolC family protein [Bacteroidales bacterium]
MKRIFSTFVMLIAALVSLSAQQVEGTESSTLRFSLKQAQDYALEHSRTLQNSALSVRQAEADKWTSIASMLPQVSASLDYSNSLGYKMELGAMSISMPPSGNLGVNVAMAVSGAQIVSTQLAKISVEMANVQKLQTEQDIVQQVKLLYFSALVSQQTQGLLEESLVTIKKLYDFINKSVEVGVAEKIDADQILVQVATMESTLNTSKRSLEMVFNSLRLAMNIPFNVEIELT